MADKRMKARKIRSPKLTRIEKLTKGLLAERDVNTIFAVKELKGKGRGVFLRIPILHKDSFVLEYEGDIISEAEAKEREKMYAYNNEGCFIMSFKFQGSKMAIDATRKYDSLGRLLNHSREPNIRFHSPFVIDLNGIPRIAGYALRDIYKGEEIVIDYGVRDGSISWLRNREVGFTADVDSDPCDGNDCNSSSNSQAECQLPLKIPPLKATYVDSDASSLSSDVMSAETFTRTRKETRVSEWSKKKSDVCGIAFSKDFGARFTRTISGGKKYLVGLEGLGVPQKIMKFIEENSERKRYLEGESLDCLSFSSYGSNMRIETSSTLSRRNIESQTSSVTLNRAFGNTLPSNKAPDSINKVLEWQMDSPSHDSIMDIKIVGVQSLVNYPGGQGNTNSNLSSSYRQHSTSALTAQETSVSSIQCASYFEKDVQQMNQNYQPYSSASSFLLPLSASRNTEQLIVTVDISDSDEKSESSSVITSSLKETAMPEPTAELKLVAESTKSIDLSGVYVISDDDCVSETAVSDKQLKMSEEDFVIEKCFESESSSSECEIVLTEVPTSSTDLGKLSSLPARRPVGFSSAPSAQLQVAVIKPYVSPNAHDVKKKDIPAVTESELQQMKIICYKYIASNDISQIEVQQAIYSNWDFFSVLIKRGISVNQIKSIFIDFTKKLP